MAAGSPQHGEIGLSFVYKYIVSQRRMASIASRKEKARLWGGCEEKLPLETNLVPGGAYTLSASQLASK